MRRIVKLIVIRIVFSSFNNVDMCHNMSAGCCMPWSGAGAPWRPWDKGGCHGQPVHVFYLALASFHCMSGVRHPTTNQQPTTNPPIISVPLGGDMIMKGVLNWHSISLGYKDGDSKSDIPKEVT